MVCSNVIIGGLFGLMALTLSIKEAMSVEKKKDVVLWAIISLVILTLVVLYVLKFTNLKDWSCNMGRDAMALLKPGSEAPLLPDSRKIGKPFDTLPDALAPWAIAVNLRFPGTKFGP